MMQPSIARMPKTSSLVKCRAAENDEAWNVSFILHSCFFANLPPCWCLVGDVTLRWLQCIGTRCRGVVGVSVKQSCECFS